MQETQRTAIYSLTDLPVPSGRIVGKAPAKGPTLKPSRLQNKNPWGFERPRKEADQPEVQYFDEYHDQLVYIVHIVCL